MLTPFFLFPNASPLEHQFNFPDADVVLQTIDHSDFCVHSCILAAASPFFSVMFTFPQGL